MRGAIVIASPPQASSSVAHLATRVVPTTPAAKSADGQLLPTPPQLPRLPEDHFDLDAWTRAVVSAALERNGGSPVRTAAYLGLTRKVLYTLRKRYGLLAGREDDET